MTSFDDFSSVRFTSVRELGAVLRSRRRSLSLSQSQVAEEAGVTRQWLAQLEKGKSSAEIGRCLRVIDVLAFDIVLSDRSRSAATAEDEWDLDDLGKRWRTSGA